MFKQYDHGCASVDGALTLDTVALVWQRSHFPIADGQVVNLDLSGVTESDSAGLALLLEWSRLAKKAGKNLQFVNFPPQLTSIAKSINVDVLLQVKEGNAEPTISADAKESIS